MKLYRIVIVYFLVSILAGLVNAKPVRAAPARICKPAIVTDIIAWLPGHDVGVPVAKVEPLKQALYSLTGPTFWVRSGSYGYFDIPKGAINEATFWILPGRQFMWFASHLLRPDVVFVYSFPNDAEFAGAHGQHFGVHPLCGAFVISREQADVIYKEAN